MDELPGDCASDTLNCVPRQIVYFGPPSAHSAGFMRLDLIDRRVGRRDELLDADGVRDVQRPRHGLRSRDTRGHTRAERLRRDGAVLTRRRLAVGVDAGRGDEPVPGGLEEELTGRLVG